MGTKLVNWDHNGFHGHITICLRVPASASGGDEVEVSRATAKRLNNLVCGMSDCRCGESVAHEDYETGRCMVRLPDGESVRGNYPQA